MRQKPPVVATRMTDLPIASGPCDVAEATDGELIAWHRAGDRDAFDLLYKRYRRRLVEFCTARTGDRHGAEDLAHETFLRVLLYVDSLHADRRTLWPWLRTTASRLIIDGRLGGVCDVGGTDDLAGQDRPPSALVAHADVDHVEWRILIDDAIGQLPARQQTALRLFYASDWTAAEAGRSMGLGRPAFRQLVLRARRNLHAELTRSSHLGVALLLPLIHRVRSVGARLRARTAATNQAAGMALAAAEGMAQSLAMAAVVAGLALGMADPADVPLPEVPTPVAVTVAGTERDSGAPWTALRPGADAAGTRYEVVPDTAVPAPTVVVAPLNNPVDEDAEASVTMNADEDVVTVEDVVWMSVLPQDDGTPLVEGRTDLHCGGAGADVACSLLRTAGDLVDPADG